MKRPTTASPRLRLPSKFRSCSVKLGRTLTSTPFSTNPSVYFAFDKVFNRMDRAVVHGSTFGANDLAMACGIATLELLKSEGLIKTAERTGQQLLRGFAAMIPRYEFLREVRGKG